MDILLKNVKKKDLQVIRSLAKALGYEIDKPEEKPYDPEFVKEILQASEDMKNGKSVRIDIKDIDQYLGT